MIMLCRVEKVLVSYFAAAAAIAAIVSVFPRIPPYQVLHCELERPSTAVAVKGPDWFLGVLKWVVFKLLFRFGKS